MITSRWRYLKLPRNILVQVPPYEQTPSIHRSDASIYPVGIETNPKINVPTWSAVPSLNSPMLSSVTTNPQKPCTSVASRRNIAPLFTKDPGSSP